MKRIIYIGTPAAVLQPAPRAPQQSDQLERARAATQGPSQQPLASRHGR